MSITVILLHFSHLHLNNIGLAPLDKRRYNPKTDGNIVILEENDASVDVLGSYSKVAISTGLNRIVLTTLLAVAGMTFAELAHRFNFPCRAG